MKRTTMRTQLIGTVLLAGLLTACGGSSADKFREAMTAGNLTKAQEHLTNIDDRAACKLCARQLIQAYLEVDEPDKAIHVYENITPWHRNRSDLDLYKVEYEKEVCQMLRTYLVKNGEYERAWNYYPLEYDDENSILNAKSRYAYISDIVAALCAKSRQEEARRFAEDQLRWFVTYVDSDNSTFKNCIDTKEAFNSTSVREKLQEQIDNSY